QTRSPINLRHLRNLRLLLSDPRTPVPEIPIHAMAVGRKMVGVSFAVLQHDATDPTPEQLVAAFAALANLTAMDARRRADDACGILADRLSGEEAEALLAALREQGIAATAV